MNLTLYRIESFDESDRTLYVLAPDARAALQVATYHIPAVRVRVVTAVANNAYRGDDFPRFIGWEEAPVCIDIKTGPHPPEPLTPDDLGKFA